MTVVKLFVGPIRALQELDMALYIIITNIRSIERNPENDWEVTSDMVHATRHVIWLDKNVLNNNLPYLWYLKSSHQILGWHMNINRIGTDGKT